MARSGVHAACVAVVALLWSAAPAPAATTYVERHGPIRMGGYNIHYVDTVVRPPRERGYVVRLHARLVDRRGRPVTIRDVMLHHVIFRRKWHPRVVPECTSGAGEAFYSTGEEDQTLRLPAGHGYPVHRGDRWKLTAMLMSHAVRTRDVFIEYRVTMHTRSRLVPVRAYWPRAVGCAPTTSYPVAGDGPPGSTDVRRFEWRIPYAGRIVAAGGHLHGGAKDMWLEQPRCGSRRLLSTRPRYGMPDDLMYRLQPTLHEPGPMDTSYFISAKGIPIAAGETLRLSAAYDNTRPHWMVMSTMHLYVARDRRAGRAGCRPLPADARHLVKPGRARTVPPVVDMGLNTLDARGRPFRLTTPPWPLQPVGDGAIVDVRSEGFSVPNVAIAAGAHLTWRFTEREYHNVTFASGPRPLGTPNLHVGQGITARFSVPGRYEFFCSLHPMSMHQVVDVTAP